MAEYRKYMFDDFVVEKSPEEISQTEMTDGMGKSLETEFEIQEEAVSVPTVESFEKTEEDETVDNDLLEEMKETAYSQDELDAAVRQASEEAYNRGAEEVKQSLNANQVKLMEEIATKLTLIFNGIEKEISERELCALKVAVNAVRKIFPTLEKERAEEEIKNFLKENFGNFSSQEMLSFSFHPDSIPLIAESLEKMAQKHDFEGKISVHKDSSLGLSDCRVEWKNGGVERKASAILDKIEDLTDNNEQERENGE